MAGRVEGKVALVTGAARGMGRSHAVRLAQEGASVIALDACRDIATVPYPLATRDELDETVRLVERAGGRAYAAATDVRDLAGLEQAVAEGVAALGDLDIVVANAGISSYAPAWELSEEQWQDMIDVNLTGAWKTVKATVPRMLARGAGGSVVLISSIGGLVGMLNIAHYVAAKHGVTGLMRTLAAELAPSGIRVNSVHPTTVDTPLVDNPAARALVTGGDADATREDAAAALQGMSAMPVPWVEAIDISHAVVYLASEEARYVTGTTMVVDAGARAPFKIPHEATAAP